jgi:hypothetical protein
MLSKIAIGLAAAAIAMGGSTLSVSAMHGGGHGGGPHGGMVSGFGPHGGGRGYAVRGYGHDHWRGGHHGYRYGYRYYRPYHYSYGGSCWRWTPEGRIWVCGRGYGYGPSYGYYRGGWGHHRGGYGFGPHGGGRHFR